MRHIAWLLVLLFVVPVAFAQKRPWDIPDEERIARRVDPDAIRARVPKERAHEPDINIIVGRQHPELFLPWELYRDAVDTYLVAPADWRARQRAVANDHLRVFTDPIAFWDAFEKASAPYTEILVRENAIIEKLNATPASEHEPLIDEFKALQQSHPQCGPRAAGLAAAEQAVGRETLYRFLYEVVAVSITSTTTGVERADQLRFIAKGCR